MQEELNEKDCPSFVSRRRRVRVCLSFIGEPSLTRQEFAADADINNIVRKYLTTGVIDMPNLNRPTVDGLEAPGDFSESCQLLFELQSQPKAEESAQSSTEDSAQPKAEESAQPKAEESAQPKAESN